MRQVYNFSPGPGMLPKAVLETAQREMLNWRDTGMSVMEIGHRTTLFLDLAHEIEIDFREVMQVPANYEILFVAGGATNQFGMVPLNLMGENRKADYFNTGLWSTKAKEEASRFGSIHVVSEATRNAKGLLTIPSPDHFVFSQDADYVHYTPNETIDGLAFQKVPEVPSHVPLVADMTSMIMSEPTDVSRYGVIYAGAQKNLGQAGLTVVIIRKDLIKEPLFTCPVLTQYQTYAKNASLYNTPPTYAWYMLGLMLKWAKEQGGVDGLYQQNRLKAQKIYTCIDEYPDFYRGRVDPQYRSLMNVCFDLPTEELLAQFLQESAERGLMFLKGHRMACGVRASIYNPMPLEGVDALCEFMQDFIHVRVPAAIRV